jgi:hypothetical protein
MYIKLYNNKNNEVLIGPVDSQGDSQQDSINYLYEGTLWRMFNMLSMIYPNAIINTDAVKSLKFKINANTAEYLDLIEKLSQLSFPNEIKIDKVVSNDKINQNIIEKNIRITTSLWEHQQFTVNKIIKDAFELGRKGFGDASNVGAGKTLTALAIMAKMYNENIKKKIYNYSSFLVLLPTTYLYKTWEDEIKKHCQGYHLVFQNSNGTLTGDLQMNSILITTLGRMRDHPLLNSWIFVVIDECLSVQNKNALQTEEAWRQIISSQYGVLMMSATFFRTRFDKLFYLLKMLNTGLPENKSYLDAILAESIVSHLPTKTRNWSTTYHPFDLPKNLRKDYDLILEKELTSEKLYIKLQAYLYDYFDYISAFEDIIKKCEKNKRRCLIYAKSKEEADSLSQIKNVTRFPDISGKHLAISYTEGTYGLNNLVYLDTIVTRFPEPDKLPQMKGRLDRPNQKSDNLYIEYLYITDTIDQAGMVRLELANNFYNNYILPLADFYDIAVGKKKMDYKK